MDLAWLSLHSDFAYLSGVIFAQVLLAYRTWLGDSTYMNVADSACCTHIKPPSTS